jgi:glycosyltransferase involved in cell wall biosynthesis
MVLSAQILTLGLVSSIWIFLIRQASSAHSQLVRIRPNPDNSKVPLGSVAVFIPARNEAEVIEESIRSVTSQAAPVQRVIVIDDNSTDKTPEILAALAQEFEHLEILKGTEPEPGCCGKPSALLNAYTIAQAKQEWLLFLDADVILNEDAVKAMLEWSINNEVDLLSGYPKIDLESPIEKIVMPSVAALIGRNYPPSKVMDLGSSCAFANGQMILVRRTSYEGVGGHRAVLSEILEDVRLAEVIKASGGRLGLANLDEIARTRMYANWSELSEGWTKNLHLLLGGGALGSIIWAILSVLLGCSGLLLLALLSLPWNIAGFITVTTAQMYIRKRLGFPWFWSLFSAFASLCTAWIILQSAWKHTMGGKIQWKGRSYESE